MQLLQLKRPSDYSTAPANAIPADHSSKTKAFIKKARAKHGDLYDYSKTVYVHRLSKVTIICSEHGEFKQRARDHLSGYGCRECGGAELVTTESFIIKARDRHGDRYDYSKTVYVRSKSKVIITCREHGEFEQAPTDHLTGCGCPRCPYRYSEPTSVYLMANGKQVKIGYSIDPDKRLIELNRAQPFVADIMLSWVMPDAPTARAVEADIHNQLADYHAGLSGFAGATEWFNTTPLHAQAVIANTIKQVTAAQGDQGGYNHER